MRAASGATLRAILSRDHHKSVGRGNARRYDEHALRLAQIGWRRDQRHRNGQRAALCRVHADQILSGSRISISSPTRTKPRVGDPLSAAAKRSAFAAGEAASTRRRTSRQTTACAAGEVGPTSSVTGKGTRSFPSQYDASVEEIAKLERTERPQDSRAGKDRSEEIELDRTCALLSARDAVVSAPPAVSGGGFRRQPASRLTRFSTATSWTSFGTKLEPFAPACQCLMPDDIGNWDQAFAKAKAALSARLSCTGLSARRALSASARSAAIRDAP